MKGLIMLKSLRLVALASLAALVLGFGGYATAAMIRDGPRLDQLNVSDQNGRAGTMVIDVAALESMATITPLTNINQVSSTLTTGLEDGFGIARDNVAALPLLFYIVVGLTAIAALVIEHQRRPAGFVETAVKKARRRRGRVALNSLLRPLGYAGSALGVALASVVALLATSSHAYAGNGGYLAQDGSSFPIWTLIVLALGSVTLVAGGAIARRAGK